MVYFTLNFTARCRPGACIFWWGLGYYCPPPSPICIWMMIQKGFYINSQNISSGIGIILNISYISFSQSWHNGCIEIWGKKKYIKKSTYSNKIRTLRPTHDTMDRLVFIESAHWVVSMSMFGYIYICPLFMSTFFTKWFQVIAGTSSEFCSSESRSMIHSSGLWRAELWRAELWKGR